MHLLDHSHLLRKVRTLKKVDPWREQSNIITQAHGPLKRLTSRLFNFSALPRNASKNSKIMKLAVIVALCPNLRTFQADMPGLLFMEAHQDSISVKASKICKYFGLFDVTNTKSLLRNIHTLICGTGGLFPPKFGDLKGLSQLRAPEHRVRGKSVRDLLFA
jgi:hypothetical protein